MIQILSAGSILGFINLVATGEILNCRVVSVEIYPVAGETSPAKR